MKQLNVYVAFPGNCREALDFYKECFNGEILSLQTYGEAPENQFPDHSDKVMHAEFKADGLYFMCCDNLQEGPATTSGMISLSVAMDNENDQTEIFNKLSAGALVTMPLQDTFWGARFGMLNDRFGIGWMFNCEKDK